MSSELTRSKSIPSDWDVTDNTRIEDVQEVVRSIIDRLVNSDWDLKGFQGMSAALQKEEWHVWKLTYFIEDYCNATVERALQEYEVHRSTVSRVRTELRKSLQTPDSALAINTFNFTQRHEESC